VVVFNLFEEGNIERVVQGRAPRYRRSGADMSTKAVIDEAGALREALTHLQEQLQAIRTGAPRRRWSRHPRRLLRHADAHHPDGAISIPEPRQIMIKPFDASVLKELQKACSEPTSAASPQDDGKVLRLTLPPLSGEQRQKYSAKVKEMCEETRVRCATRAAS
jgi:ribosome recycling factor